MEVWDMGQRINQRIHLNTEAMIICGEKKLLGVLSDLSLSGIYIRMDTPITPGNSAEVIFFNKASSRNSAVKVRGRVVRSDNEGIGFRVKQTDVDSFINMHLMMAKHTVKD
jgi:hypothetical protein